MARLCLNMIVKNEAARIERCLKSAAPHIHSYVICDTGSTDGTPSIIEGFFKRAGIPGHVICNVEFKDFSHARNYALRAAKAAAELGHDYLLLMDADMELRLPKPEALNNLTGRSYDVYQFGGSIYYQNRRLLRADTAGCYVGVTHEYLDVETDGLIPITDMFFIDHADGTNRIDKFKRDIKLLRNALKTEPNNARYYYYLAQSYKDAGQFDKAVEWFRRRVKAGGWDEEVWSAQLNLAHAVANTGDEDGFLVEMLKAYSMRPSRAETMHDLANYYRKKGNNPLAAMFARNGMAIEHTKDALFVNDYAYSVGCAEEFAISGFYLPQFRDRAFHVNDMLALKRTPYTSAVELARVNMYHYIKRLGEVAPSFKWKTLRFKPEVGWRAMNPSVTLHQSQAVINIRTVNYVMDEHGRYLINDLKGGECNSTNPINTRNFLMWLGKDPMGTEDAVVSEVHAPIDLPCEFPYVIGFEDLRLISRGDELWSSSTVRQIDRDGNCEQVLAKLTAIQDRYYLTDVKRMLRAPRETQKNWMPIDEYYGNWPNTDPSFIYRLGEVVNSDGKTTHKHDTGLSTGHISGGSQAISFGEGWLALVHEARYLDNGQRYYWHRFAYFGRNFELELLSLPFVFNDKVIEFAAGLCRHPADLDTLVLSYGFKDKEACIGTISVKDVWCLLEDPSWYQ